MATAKSSDKTTPEVVESDSVDSKATGVSEPGAGTKPGEKIASTPAEGVKAPEGGALPEATPDELPEQPAKNESAKTQDSPSQPDPDVNQPDVAVEQMRLQPGTGFASQGREAPYLPSADTNADATS